MKHDLYALKGGLLIPQVWEHLGLPGQPGTSCHSPFRSDKTPSFSVYDGDQRWKDFATGASGDVIDFIATATGVDNAEATRQFLTLAGVQSASSSTNTSAMSARPRHPLYRLPARDKAPRSSSSSSSRPIQEPSSISGPQNPGGPLRRGSAANLKVVARSRQIDPAAVSLAQSLGTLAFAEICGFPCWLLGDSAHRIVEARRMDGLTFPATSNGTLAERKAHTLRGSHKDWPVGVSVLERLPHFRAILLVEGGPDYLAALHFAIQMERWDVLPIAMLGRSTGARIAPEALELLKGRRVRIYPHVDPDGGGVTSARLWAAQLHAQGCEVDLYDFSELTRPDGQPVTDLNDAALLSNHPSQPNQQCQNPTLRDLLP